MAFKAVANELSRAKLDTELQGARQQLAELEKERDRAALDLSTAQKENAVLTTESINLQDDVRKAQDEEKAGGDEMEAADRSASSGDTELKLLHEQVRRLRERRAVIELACQQLPGTGVEGPAPAVADGPLLSLAAEAVHISKQTFESLELQIRDTAMKTVAFDHEREALENEERALAEELVQVRQDYELLQELSSGSADALSFAAGEVKRLQLERVGLEEQVHVATQALQRAEQEQDTMQAHLLSQKRDTKALKDLTSDALSDVSANCSKASRLKQSAVTENSREQKDLLCKTSSHSQLISATGTHQVYSSDLGSPEMQMSLQRASLPVLHLSGSGALSARGPRSEMSLSGSGALSARGPRSEFRGVGKLVIGR